MSFVDILILIPVLWGAYKGFKKGLVFEVASLAALILGIYGGAKLSGYAGTLISDLFNSDSKYIPIIAFAVIFILIVILVHVLGKWLDKLVKNISLNFLNKLFGAIFNAAKIAFVISIIVLIINKIDEESKFMPPDFSENSLLYEPVGKLSITIIPALNTIDFNQQK